MPILLGHCGGQETAVVEVSAELAALGASKGRTDKLV